jgi:hypothetical protein
VSSRFSDDEIVRIVVSVVSQRVHTVVDFTASGLGWVL